MKQIIGAYKEFLVIERKALEEIEQNAKQKLDNHKDKPLSESTIEAKAVLDTINWIKENNIYNQDFKIKG